MNELSIVAIELIGGGIITAALSVVGWYLQRLVRNMDEWKADRERHETEMMERVQNLEMAIMSVQDSMSERLAREQELLAQIHELAKEVAMLKRGNVVLLRDRIMQGRRYFTELGYIPAAEFENLEQMDEVYEDMGGNGVAKRAFSEISTLPFEAPTN